ncbi:Do family serine endopeptidase [Candidatus Cardinium hertigii]|jgi:Do/DeqQ family serine protease|uniref:Do family serine endopeptidase n=1 Tax=Candidatus Cardinium hertigii TaxID=247481 RepID=A0A3N2QB32_9BACT|nr:Do family serine endopeptidase [Candidatus Cardinium hertigii]ROT46951.1 Do family serine endopeptidase [Candidatus Cardinium hertigii]
MYKHNRFSKESIVKTVFCSAIAVILGLSLWLGKLYTARNFLATVGNAKQVSTALGEQRKDHTNVVLADHRTSLTTPEIPSKTLINPSTEGHNVLANVPDLTYAAKLATPAVVHIQARQNAKKQRWTNPLDQILKDFFGEGFPINPREREYEKPAQFVSGSGVIYTNNGYIITNNHVIEGADLIEVTLNDNRYYVAKLIGGDPLTDLALLKIEEKNLPVLKIGSSDNLEVGEWVLAVGNPFNLNSTVTKGIVSAKSRGDLAIGGANKKLGIQSFIQTDAVINQGNSGGALVNLYGELVGINTAILFSITPTFIGYGFAIPSSLVKKVANDLIQYGVVQRALLGVSIDAVTPELVKKLGLKRIGGVYIVDIQENSPCVHLFQKEDVITHINGRKVDKVGELQEIIACSKPGDRVNITLYRKGKEKTIEVVLEKEPDAIKIVQKDNSLQVEGATFQDIDPKTKAKFNITYGVLIKEVAKGKFQSIGLKKDCILLTFDRQPVNSILELSKMIRHTKGPVLLGIMESNKGPVRYFGIDLYEKQ